MTTTSPAGRWRIGRSRMTAEQAPGQAPEMDAIERLVTCAVAWRVALNAVDKDPADWEASVRLTKAETSLEQATLAIERMVEAS